MRPYLILAVSLTVCLAQGVCRASGGSVEESADSRGQSYAPGQKQEISSSGPPTLIVGALGTPPPGMAKHIENLRNPPLHQKLALLGTEYYQAGEYGKALDAYKRSLALYNEELKVTHELEQPSAMGIVKTYEALGDFASATAELEKIIGWYEALGNHDPSGPYWDGDRPIDMACLEAYRQAMRGRYDLAVTHLRKAADLHLERFAHSPRGRKKTYDKWQPRIAALEQKAREAGQLP